MYVWWVRILHSAEEDNLSRFDSNIACLCQRIEINNNKHVYRQSQVRMLNGFGVEWAECSLIIGKGCRVHIFSLIFDSSVGFSAGIQSAGDLVSETLMGSNPAFGRGRHLLSFRFEISLACARASKLTTINMYIVRARCECQTAVGSSGLNARWS